LIKLSLTARAGPAVSSAGVVAAVMGEDGAVGPLSSPAHPAVSTASHNAGHLISRGIIPSLVVDAKLLFAGYWLS
jgi:hypothetical protein